MSVFWARFTPFGKFVQVLKNGLWPWAIAYGVQLNNHVCHAGSPHKQPGIRDESPGKIGQYALSASPAYRRNTVSDTSHSRSCRGLLGTVLELEVIANAIRCDSRELPEGD